MLFQEFLKNFSNYSTDCLKCLQSSPRAFPGVPSRIPSWIFPGISLGTSPGIPSEIVTCISLGIVQRISSGIAQAFLEAFSFNNSGISLNIYRDCFRNALRVSSQIPVFSSLVSIDSSGSTSELSLQAFLCFLRKPVQSLILHSRLGFWWNLSRSSYGSSSEILQEAVGSYPELPSSDSCTELLLEALQNFSEISPALLCKLYITSSENFLKHLLKAIQSFFWKPCIAFSGCPPELIRQALQNFFSMLPRAFSESSPIFFSGGLDAECFCKLSKLP